MMVAMAGRSCCVRPLLWLLLPLLLLLLLLRLVAQRWAG
jgi:hypothetical protein